MKKQIIITTIITVIICITGTSLAAYKLKAEQVSFDKSNTNLNVEDVQKAIDELGLSLSNSKQLLAEEITNKGVETKDTDSFMIMANNIGKITSDVFIERKTITRVWGTSHGNYTHTVKASDVGLKYIFGAESDVQHVGNAGTDGASPNMHQDSLTISTDYTSFTARGWNSYYSANATQTYTCIGVK